MEAASDPSGDAKQFEAAKPIDADFILSRISALLGERVEMLHPRRVTADAFGGGDLDLAVFNLDRNWPMRAPQNCRIYGCIQYDITGWFWIVEIEDHLIAIDTLDDPRGLGKYGFPTSLIEEDMKVEQLAAVRAAYLTAKRILKDDRSRAAWEPVADMANADPHSYEDALSWTFGSLVAKQLRETVLAGLTPSRTQRRKARTFQVLRRFRSPSRFAAIVVRSSKRPLQRLRFPTGMTLTVVGPDGTGKSTLSTVLAKECRELFRSILGIHWRPGMLPRPGSLFGTTAALSTDPHGLPTRNAIQSLALLGYFWIDFLLGGWLLIGRRRVQAGLVIVERGWADISVDPRRYRLKVSPRLVRVLGKVLPLPDLGLILEAPIHTLRERKKELPERELERQISAWRSLSIARAQTSLDTGAALEDVSSEAMTAVKQFLSSRAQARVGRGWTAIHENGRVRWLLPRGPRKVALSALSIYHPVTPKGLVCWNLARVGARVGLMGVLPRAAAPRDETRHRLSSFIPTGGTLAVMDANHAARQVVMLLDRNGRPSGVAKLAFDDEGRQALRREATAIKRLATLLAPPFHPPQLLEEAEGMLITQPVDWIPRSEPWNLGNGLAFALGQFWAGGSQDGSLGPGLTHGDFAPWNLLKTRNGYTVIDWESARTDGPPFFDVFHYLVQSHALLSRPSFEEIVEGFDGVGWVGRTLQAYASGAGLHIDQAPKFFAQYLVESRAGLNPYSGDGEAGISARNSLLNAFERKPS